MSKMNRRFVSLRQIKIYGFCHSNVTLGKDIITKNLILFGILLAFPGFVGVECRHLFGLSLKLQSLKLPRVAGRAKACTCVTSWDSGPWKHQFEHGHLRLGQKMDWERGKHGKICVYPAPFLLSNKHKHQHTIQS